MKNTKIFTILFLFLEMKFSLQQQFQLNASKEEKCIIYTNGIKQEKLIGETWHSTTDPCLRHICEKSSNNQTAEKTFREYCFLTCNNEFEHITKEGQCCGECIQTKCKVNDTIYEPGSTWKSPNGCTFNECIRIDSGVKITSYTKACPSIENCPKNRIYSKNCCKYCRSVDEPDTGSVNEKNDDYVYNPAEYNKFMNKSTYEHHPCKRKCLENSSMICNYTFVVEWYETLSKACYNCPENTSDCFRPHCIFADGIRRTIMVINRMLPGPQIEVCLGDTLVVDVVNDLMGEGTTIHWHGMHQRHTPFMDGVPHVTQCPITSQTTFRYIFKADNDGTHWWHSHTGVQRSDGAYGALIVRKPINETNHHYDDLKEFTMLIQDWHHQTGVSGFNSFHHSIADNKPRNILINGKGKYIKPIVVGDEAHTEVDTEATQTTEPTFTTIAPEATTLLNEETTIKATTHKDDNPLTNVPIEIFHVNHGEMYKFRMINAGFLNCPVELSIDNHRLLAVASDGYDIEPIMVDSMVSYAGERWDFVVNASQAIGNYWIRVRGLMDCDERFTRCHQVAILRYKTAAVEDPPGTPIYDYPRHGIQLNPLNRGTQHNDSISVAELSATYDDDEKLMQPKADYKFYIYYDFYNRDNPHFNDPNLYSIHSVPNPNNQFFGPQLNLITMKMPPRPFLIDKDNIDDSTFCNITSLLKKNIDCKKEFCECSHVLQVPLNASVELVIVDEGYKYDANHPFHLHGHGFRVVAMERLKPSGISIEEIQALDEGDKLARRLSKAPLKDTITVPDGGYTIIRFIANNPGYWLFHCHIDYHVEVGMALVFKIGSANQMPEVPNNFPTCWNYLPKVNNNTDDSTNNLSHRKNAFRNIALLVLASVLLIKHFISDL